MKLHQFVIEHVFNKYITKDNETIFWRECIDGSGYIVLFSDGEHYHSYRHPEEEFSN